MHAIILAAGRGNRPAKHDSEALPYCLAEIGGHSLLARQLDLLYRFGIRAADLVVGYEARRVIDHVGTLASRPDVAYHFNPRYELGSVLSLLAAAETLESGDDVLVMDADLLCHPGILQRLIESAVENCFLLDGGVEIGDSAFRAALHDGRMVEFGERFSERLAYDSVALPVGFYRFGGRAAACISEECARFESEGLGDAPYEEVLRNVMMSCPLAFGFEDVGGLPWIRVESPGDVSRAEEQLLTAIRD